MRSWFTVLSLTLTFGTLITLQEAVSAAPPPAPPKNVAAQVNGEPITTQALNNRFRDRTRVSFETVQDNPRAQQVRKQILEQMIGDVLLVQDAERRKFPVTPEMVNERFTKIREQFPSEEAFTQRLRARGLTAEQLKANIKKGLLYEQIIHKEIVEKVSVSPKELQTFFQKHKDDYVQKEAVHARHILIKVAPDASPEDDQKAKARAKSLMAKAKKGADFAQLAKQYSDGPSKEQGGDLGFFARGQMVKRFEEAAFKLKVGEISDPVRTKFGYHIIKAEGRRKAKRFSYKEAKDRVKADLTKEKATARYREYITTLRKKAKVTVHLK